MNTPFSNLPPGVVVAIVVGAVIEVALFAIALRAWLKTPADRMPGGNKWAWLAALLVAFIGPIAFLVSRKPAPVTETDAPDRSASAAVEVLYGDNQ